MEKRQIESDHDPRAYADVFARLTSGSPPPPPGRFERLVAEMRRRTGVLGQRVQKMSIVFVERVRARAAVVLSHGREESAALARRAREARVALVRRMDDERVLLVERVGEVRGALGRLVREERARLMRRVGEVTAALVRRMREDRVVLGRRKREQRAALARAVRDHGAALAARVRDDRTAFEHRLHDWAEARPRWKVGWHRSGPPTIRREPSIFLGLASFAFAFGVAWWTGGPTDEVPERKTAFVAEQAVPSASVTMPSDTQPAVLGVGQVLRTPGVSEAAQLAVVDELTRDASDEATKALLAGVDAESVHVSMACLRALSGRSCDSVGAALAERLDDPMWQRRAWAARVLGANDCASAGRRLAQRLAVEPDLRVQAQLQFAIDSLKEPGA